MDGAFVVLVHRLEDIQSYQKQHEIGKLHSVHNFSTERKTGRFAKSNLESFERDVHQIITKGLCTYEIHFVLAGNNGHFTDFF